MSKMFRTKKARVNLAEPSEQYRPLNDDDLKVLSRMFPESIFIEQLKTILLKHSSYQNIRIIDGDHEDDRLKVVLEGDERLLLTDRIYIPRPADDFDYRTLPLEVQLPYFCIMSRVPNGYIREKFTRDIIASSKVDTPHWVAPYLVMSVADYVTNISTLLPGLISKDQKLAIKRFKDLNEPFISLMDARANSYSNLNGVTYKESVIYTFFTKLNSS